MACSCLYLADLAQAFANEGASKHLRWNVTVDLDYVDAATVSLVRSVGTAELTLRKAGAETMREEAAAPHYGPGLKHYPREMAITRLQGR